MAITEGNIEVTTTGDKLDTTVVTQTDGTTAHREVVSLADPEVLAAYAKVSDHTVLGAYGVHVYNTADIRRGETFDEILAELRVLNKQMALITGADLTTEEIV